MSNDGSNQQVGLEGWRKIKYKDIQCYRDFDMWLWNLVTDTNWLTYLWIIGIIVVLYLGFS